VLALGAVLMMTRAVPAFVLAAGLASALCGCRHEPRVEVDFTRREPPHQRAVTGRETLRVAVGGMLGPEATYGSFEALATMLAARVGRRAVLIERRTYDETNRMLLSGEVDVAFVCTGAYTPIRDRVRFLAAPVTRGSASYYSYLVARVGGPTSPEALRGARFGFTDPLSNTGHLYPVFLLRTRFDAEPQQFFSGTVYTGGHDESIRVLLDGTIDAAAVDSSVFDAYVQLHPREAARLSVLHRSPAFGSPPFVARLDLERDVSDAVRDALLRAHLDPSSRALLAGLGIERFAADADYVFAARVSQVALGAPAAPEAAP